MSKSIDPLSSLVPNNVTAMYVKTNDGMKIIIISIRDEEKVYKEAEARIQGME